MSESAAQPKRRGPRRLTVAAIEPVSPSLTRIRLAGEALADFPVDRPGAHIKIFLPQSHQIEPVLPEMTDSGPVWPAPDQRPITRTYSVRRFNPDQQTLDVDFVLHGDNGPASAWARAARVGDVIGVAGPGGPTPLLAPADRVLLAGDITALPAIAALLEHLPATTGGHAIVQVPQSADRLALDYAADIAIDWRVAPHSSAADTPLVAAVRAFEDPAEFGAAWLAGENAAVLAMRAHLRERLGLSRKQLYAVPYWKATFTEEAYHNERHRVMDAFDAEA